MGISLARVSALISRGWGGEHVEAFQENNEVSGQTSFSVLETPVVL